MHKEYPVFSYIIIASLLMLIGLSIPALTEAWSIYILEVLEESLFDQDSGSLLFTALPYIFRYVLIYICLFAAATFFAQSFFHPGKRLLAFQLVFVGILVSSVLLLDFIYHEGFSLGPFILSIGLYLFLLRYIYDSAHFYLVLFIMLLLLQTALQWLHIIPALTRFGFGQDDLASSIKLADAYLTDYTLLNVYGTVFFIIFFIITLLFSMLIYLFDKQIATLRDFTKQSAELHKTRNALVNTKVYQELHALVHDLKTPLVAIEGLLSLMELKYGAAGDKKAQEYFDRLNQNTNQMKDMISEMLLDNKKQLITPDELLHYVISHLDTSAVTLEIKIQPNMQKLLVNKVRFSRALSNVIENALYALEGKEGKIIISVKQSVKNIFLTVWDNGPGIPQEHLEDIWLEGFSTRSSSGLGLSFVKRVAESHNGKITVSSQPGSYTEIMLILPASNGGENDDLNH